MVLLARRVVALGSARAVITPDALLETFGIILVSQDRGREGRQRALRGTTRRAGQPPGRRVGRVARADDGTTRHCGCSRPSA